MPEPFIGEIKLVPFNVTPRGWADCNGQSVPINQNQALYSLLGLQFGGNGTTTFNLPDLRDRSLIGTNLGGSNAGLTTYPNSGVATGSASVTLSAMQMPAHRHELRAVNGLGNVASPANAHLAAAPAIVGATYGAAATTGTMPTGTVSSVGAGAAHENRQPFLTVKYIIALVGLYPTRP